jgi:hypothetical protein
MMQPAPAVCDQKMVKIDVRKLAVTQPMNEKARIVKPAC